MKPAADELCTVVRIPSMPEACTIQLSGPLEITTIDVVESCCIRLIEEKVVYVIADMSKVNFVASVALGKLLSIRQRLVKMGGDLVLMGLGVDLKIRLGLMGATKIFKVFGDNRSALSAYAFEGRHEASQISLSFPAQMRLVPAVRSFVSHVVKQKGYSDRDCFRTETIVDEICNNAVQYGLQCSDANVALRLTVGHDRVEIDTQNTTDPARTEKLRQHIESMKEKIVVHSNDTRGRGLALVKMLACDLAANITDTGTTVHVTKLKEG